MAVKINVELADRSYTISIGRDLLHNIGSSCARRKLGDACLLVTDGKVAPLYAEPCEQSLVKEGFKVRRMVVPPRESSKSNKWLMALYDAALEHGMGRDSFMLALGGGVVGDLAGYAAATYMRGIRFVQAPTTLLAMVDSSVGGKTGINLPQGKNLIGAFHQPAAVYADLTALDTLPDREYRSGLAEVIKYGVIEDACFFNSLEKNIAALKARDGAMLERVVARCCEIKAEVVRFDEKERGLRAILNFGHTFGHALENCCGYGKLLHGEAIAIGMVFVVRLSQIVGDLPESMAARVVGLLEELGLPTRAPSLAFERLIEAMGKDKKNKGTAPSFVLAKRIGHVEPGCVVPESVLRQVWKEITRG